MSQNNRAIHKTVKVVSWLPVYALFWTVLTFVCVLFIVPCVRGWG